MVNAHTLKWITASCDADQRDTDLASRFTLEDAVEEYAFMQMAVEVWREL